MTHIEAGHSDLFAALGNPATDKGKADAVANLMEQEPLGYFKADPRVLVYQGPEARFVKVVISNKVDATDGSRFVVTAHVLNQKQMENVHLFPH